MRILLLVVVVLQGCTIALPAFRGAYAAAHNRRAERLRLRTPPLTAEQERSCIRALAARDDGARCRRAGEPPVSVPESRSVGGAVATGALLGIPIDLALAGLTLYIALRGMSNSH
jgi:hypothetical protein